MILTSDNAHFELKIVGYQFPDITGDQLDSNWLIIDGSVRSDGRNWHFRDPCLMTAEIAALADWLDACADGNADRTYCAFVEPNLQFDLIVLTTVRISFSLGSAPPWAKRSEDPVHWIDFPVGTSLSVAAAELRNDLRHFPERGSRI